jgi:hypothetical protein
MRFGWWGTMAWAEPGSAHRCNEHTKLQGRRPFRGAGPRVFLWRE